MSGIDRLQAELLAIAEPMEPSNLRTALLDLAEVDYSQPTPTAKPDREPCKAETYSWDHFRPEQLDAYWIRCTEYGAHDEHRDSNTGLTWSDPSMIRDVQPLARREED